jgi:TolB-like protein/DNA-binding SARP family transcriptional activator/thioredoxin-like negative regulator of GroEL
VTDTPGEAASPPAFRLQTFGTLRLVGTGDDTILGDHGHQRRRLALLAVLAASGERGRSRDQLLGLFWPDASQSRAQHSLGQLLYAIRTSLGGDAFAGTSPLRLNSAFITSDIGDFTDALARGDAEAAVGHYRGRFLDGFNLTDAPEFEHWMDAERGRIERVYMETLERLAKSAEDARDFAAAVRWRQKLIDADPVSSKHAMGLMRAMMNAGDYAAALQYAERYEAVVARELGTSVGPAVAALVAEVREHAKTESVVVRGAPPPAVRTQIELGTIEPALGPSPRKEVQAGTPSPDTPNKRRTTAQYGIAALAVVALVVAALLLRPRDASGPASPPAATSLAVLPLANLSGDPRDAPLADGLTEELIGVVARIDHLNVVARTSAFVFKNSKLTVRQIADSLHVANILEGGVQKVGERLRVQVRLIDARDGSSRWSEAYDRELKDIFLVQSDIASAVARELNLRLGASTANAVRRRQTQNIAAYELFLRGNDRTLLRSDSTARVALEYFRQAVALDSTYAAAHAGLARMYLRLRLSDLTGTSSRGNYVLAREAALKAVALDDSLGEAHATLGLVRMTGYDFAAAENELNRAVALDPGHSRIREWLAFLYYWQDRPSDALAEALRAVENDPLSPTAHAEVGRALCANGQVEQGLARLKSLEAVQMPPARVAMYKALCHGKKGDWGAAVAELPKGRANMSDAVRGHALGHAGRRAEALGILEELTTRWKRTNDGAFLIALVYAGLDDRDRAFEWLDRSVAEVSPVTQLEQPLFDDLRADPRYQQFRKRVGLQNP